MTLKHLFIKFINEYKDELQAARDEEVYTRPFGGLVRRDIPGKINTHLDQEIYKVKGSVGAGRWTDVPWIAVFDQRITTSAQRGVYIVYLLNKDTKELFLTLNQGATDVAQGGDGTSMLAFTGIATASNSRTAENLKNKADDIRLKIGSFDGLKKDPIDTGFKAYDAGCIYYKKYSFNSLPEDDELYADLDIFIRAYQAYYDKIFAVSGEDVTEEGEEELTIKNILGGITKYIEAKGFFYDESGGADVFLDTHTDPPSVF